MSILSLTQYDFFAFTAYGCVSLSPSLAYITINILVTHRDLTRRFPFFGGCFDQVALGVYSNL